MRPVPAHGTSVGGLTEPHRQPIRLFARATGDGRRERGRFRSRQMHERRAHEPLEFDATDGLAARRRGRAGDHQRDLAALEVGIGGRARRQFAERAAIGRLEYFGELACDGGLTLHAEFRRTVLETRRDTMRRLEEHHGATFVRESSETRAPLAGFGRQKPFETESVGRDASDAQGGGDRRGTGNRAYRVARRNGAPHQIETGIGEQRRTRVTHQRDRCASFETRQQVVTALALVVGVQGHERLGETERREQLPGAARVFCGHEIGRSQRLAGARREIPEIADRCGNHVQTTLPSHYNPAPALESDGHRARRRGGIQSMRFAKLPRLASVLRACALMALPISIVACASVPAAPVASREHAAELAARGDHAGAAAEYEAAAQLSPAIGNELLLLAAREWLRVPQPPAADAALARLAPPLDAARAYERDMLGAESALLAGDATRGWTQITAIAVPTEAARANDYHALRQHMALASGKPLEAVRSARDRESLTTDDARRAAIRRELFDGLRAVGERGVRFDPRSAGKDTIARGWLEAAPLAARIVGVPQSAAMSLSASWRSRYPSHPAAPLMLELARAASAPVAKAAATSTARVATTAPTTAATTAVATPSAVPMAAPPMAAAPPPLPAGSHVAVLLPLSGRSAAAGAQVRDGLLAAYYEQNADERVPLRFYDTGAQSANDALAAATNAGASFVIGPLTRDDTNAVADAAPRMGVLALNYLSAEHAVPARFYQFGLSPEDEARAIARRVIADGRRRGIVFAPAGEWAERVVRAFREEFTAAGGTLLDTQFLGGTKEIATVIQAALRLDDSKARHERLQRVLGTTLAFQPRRRGDLDFLFTPAPSAFARQLRPQLQFFFAGDIPAYATSEIFDPAAGAQIDLDGVMLPDMPWIVQRNEPALARIRNEAADAFGNEIAARGRLFALGHDAWRLQAVLRGTLERGNGEAAMLEGLTGTLAIDRTGRVQRTLEWARIDDGMPKPIEEKP